MLSLRELMKSHLEYNICFFYLYLFTYTVKLFFITYDNTTNFMLVC